mgnify:FL=1
MLFRSLKEDEDHVTHLDPKGDQEILLEVEIPAEVKQNVDDGFDLLKQNNNKGANSSLIDFAKKITSGRQADKDMLQLWQGKFKIHQASKDHGWGKMSDKDLNALLAKEVPAGYIPWMLLGGDAGKKFVDETLSSASTGIKEDITYSNKERLQQCISVIKIMIDEGIYP